jgi:spermidine/putrescine transport system permease protein
VTTTFKPPAPQREAAGWWNESSLTRLKPTAARVALGLPLALWLAALFAAPAIVFCVYSFWRVEAFQIVHTFNLGNYRKALGGFYLHTVLNSLIIGVIVATVSCMIAFSISWAIRFRVRRGKNLILLAVVAASTGSYLARIYSWRSILGNNGAVNSILGTLGLVDHPLGWLIFDRFAVIVALINLYVPYAFLPIYVNLLNLDPEVVEAGRVLGASPLRNMRRVILPLCSVGIIISFLYVLIFATGDFAIPTFLGGPNGLPAAQVIQDQFGSSFNWPLGAAMSFVYMGVLGLVTVVLLAVAQRQSRRLAQ